MRIGVLGESSRERGALQIFAALSPVLGVLFDAVDVIGQTAAATALLRGSTSVVAIIGAEEGWKGEVFRCDVADRSP